MAHDTARRSPADHLPRRVDRTPGDYCRGQLKVDNLLRDEDRNDYYALLRKPGTTVRTALLWLRGRGYRVGRGAVKHHKRPSARRPRCRSPAPTCSARSARTG